MFALGSPPGWSSVALQPDPVAVPGPAFTSINAGLRPTAGSLATGLPFVEHDARTRPRRGEGRPMVDQIDVRDFMLGKKSNVAAAIEGAIEAGAAAGAEVFFPRGEYLVKADGTFAITANLSGRGVPLVGEPPAKGAGSSTIRAVPGSDHARETLLQLTNAGGMVSMRHLHFAGDDLVRRLVYLRGSSDATQAQVSDCVFEGCLQREGDGVEAAALRVDDSFFHVLVERSVFRSITSLGTTDSEARGLYVKHASLDASTEVRDCTFADISTRYLGPNPSPDYFLDGDAVFVHAVDLTDGARPLARSSAQISGCLFVDCMTRGIKLGTERALVFDNTFRRDRFSGLTDIGLQYGGGIVVSNRFEYTDHSAVAAVAATMRRRDHGTLVVLDNEIVLSDAQLPKSLVQCDVPKNSNVPITRVVVSDNRVRGASDSLVWLRLSAANGNVVVLHDNEVGHCTRGFVVLDDVDLGHKTVRGKFTLNRVIDSSLFFSLYPGTKGKLVPDQCAGNAGFDPPPC